MPIAVRLRDLSSIHPRLLWEEIQAALVAVVGAGEHELNVDVQDVPGFGSGLLQASIDTSGVSNDLAARLTRTYDPVRLVELAAIAVAGLAVYHAGDMKSAMLPYVEARPTTS